MKFLIILVFISSLLFADDITLHSGKIYKNIKIKVKGQYLCVIIFNDNQLEISRSDILKITEKEYDPNTPSTLVDTQTDSAIISQQGNPCEDKVLKQLESKESLTKEEVETYFELKRKCTEFNNKLENPVVIKEYKHLPLLIFSVAAFIGTYHFISKASDYNQAAELAGMLHMTDAANELNRKSTQNMILGVGCGIIGLVITVIAVKPVEVKIGPRQLSFKYNF